MPDLIQKCQHVTMHGDGSGNNCTEVADYSMLVKSDKDNHYLVWVCIEHRVDRSKKVTIK